MDIEPSSKITDHTTIMPPKTPDDADVESAKVCPSCNYTGDDYFTTCPSCGLIIKKYFKYKLIQDEKVPFLTYCKTCGNEMNPNATSCPACKGTPRSARKAVLVACSILLIVLVGVFYQMNDYPTSSGPSANAHPPQTEPSNPSTPVISHALSNSAPLSNPPTDTVSANPNSSVDIPATLPNTLGITIQRIVFASEMDGSNMPVNDLNKVPFNGKKIVVRVKMVIPPEKSYQFTGKFFDSEGKLVMNVTSPSSPTLSVWYAWYYHNFDRADDKPGIWKFILLVNGEPVLEKLIEVVDQ